jgi:hypothetical protein
MDPIPVGAGLCLRREVGQAYMENIEAHPIRKLLGRRGKNLMGGEDFDLALASFRLGLGMALFPELKLRHLIPAGRMEPDYLYRMCVVGTYSWMLVRYIHGDKIRLLGRLRRVKNQYLRWRGKLTPQRRAWVEGMELGEREIRRLKAGKDPIGPILGGADARRLDKSPAGTPA